MATALFDDADMIYAYSREDALNDGVLIDITAVASKVGFHAHTAMTHGVSTDVIDGHHGEWATPAMRIERIRQMLQDASEAIRCSGNRNASVAYFETYQVSCKVMLGPGDSGEPVFTLLLANED